MGDWKKRTVLAFAVSLLVSGASSARAAQSSGKWSGTVAAVSGDDLSLVGVPAHFRLAGGVTEMLSGRSLTPLSLAPGISVTLHVGAREADGRFPANRIIIQSKNPLAVTGAIDSIDSHRQHIEVHGVEIEINARTGFSGRSSSGAIRSARDLRTGTTVTATLVPTTAGTLRATEIQAAESESEPAEVQEFKGVLNAVTATAWTVDTRVFTVTDQTIFEGEPALGDVVEVTFHDDGAGGSIADRISKEDAPGGEVDFMGIVEAIGDSSWTISGQVVAVDASTQIIGSPQVGDNVEVEARKAADGSLTATKIKKEDAVEQEVEFTGNVESIGDSSWQIAGQTVLVNSSSRIEGNPAVGDTVEVKAMQAADGTLTAERIKKEDSVGSGEDGNGDHGGSGSGGSNNGGDSGSSSSHQDGNADDGNDSSGND